MTLIKWEDSYSVGVKFIDEQHKKLFSILNELYTKMKKGDDKLILSNIFGDLEKYVEIHFSAEEKYFDEFNYIDKEMHIAQHKIYIDKIKTFQKNYKEKKDFLSFEILDFLEDWILNHVTGIDKKYTKCFNDNGLN